MLVNCVTCDRKGFTQKGNLTEYILIHAFDYFVGEVYDSPSPPQLARSRKLKGTMNSLQGDGMFFFIGVLCPTLEIRTRGPGASALMKRNSECIKQGTECGRLDDCQKLLFITHHFEGTQTGALMDPLAPVIFVMDSDIKYPEKKGQLQYTQ